MGARALASSHLEFYTRTHSLTEPFLWGLKHSVQDPLGATVPGFAVDALGTGLRRFECHVVVEGDLSDPYISTR